MANVSHVAEVMENLVKVAHMFLSIGQLPGRLGAEIRPAGGTLYRSSEHRPSSPSDLSHRPMIPF